MTCLSSRIINLELLQNRSIESYQGVSLNDQLLAGSKTQHFISNIMFQLSFNPVVVTCNVVRMFYSKGYKEVPEGLMNGLKSKNIFHSIGNVNGDEETQVFRIKILMGSESSPLQGNCLIVHRVVRITESSKDLFTFECCKLLQPFVYIDDVLVGLIHGERAIKVTKQIHWIFQTMNMHLSKFVSNSAKVLIDIGKDASGGDGKTQKQKKKSNYPKQP